MKILGMLSYQSISFRYMHPSKCVYVLTRPNMATVPLSKVAVFSTPYQSKNDNPNVIVGFACKELLEGYVMEQGMEGHIEHGTLDEWKEFSAIMRMPLVVVTNEYTDLFDSTLHGEVYYYRPILECIV